MPFSIKVQQTLERVGEAEKDAFGGAMRKIFIVKSPYRGAFSVEMSPKD